MTTNQFILGNKNNISLSSESLAFARAVFAATGVDDLYQNAPTAAPVAKLLQPEFLESFYDPNAVTTCVDFYLNSNGESKVTNTEAHAYEKPFLSLSKKETHEEETISIIPFSEVATIRAAYADHVASFNQCAEWLCTMNGYMSARYRHGGSIHFDHAEATRRSLIHLSVVGKGATRYVPNEDAYDILRNSRVRVFASILDLRFDADSFQDRIAEFYSELTTGIFNRHDEVSETQNRLREALVPLPTGVDNVLHFLSIHSQDTRISQNRVCAKGVTHFVPR